MLRSVGSSPSTGSGRVRLPKVAAVTRTARASEARTAMARATNSFDFIKFCILILGWCCRAVNPRSPRSFLPIIEHALVAGCFPEDYKFARHLGDLVEIEL